MSVTALAVAVFLGLLGLLLWGVGWLVQELSSVLLPLAIAGIIAYLLDPVVDFFGRRKIARLSAILLVFGLAVLLVLGVAATVVPQLVRETQSLAKKMPDYAKHLEKRIDELIRRRPLGIQVPDFIHRLWRGTNITASPAATNRLGTESVSTNLDIPPETAISSAETN
ncbi:MAG: AI-2E family transporter, partial [Pedosphaera parvula]|nr:AI-2E family transporter [Pedosphaera parvula]